MTTTMQQLSVPTLTMLAGEINDAHRQVQYHAKGMLLEAKRAGEALLAAKKQRPHGTFKAWVATNTHVPYRTAARYMQVAKSVAGDTFDPDATIDSILDTHATRRETPKTASGASVPTFTATDAEYAMRLHVMATRGGSENEREVAEAKLAAFAKGFGMTAEEVVERAGAVIPEPEPLSPMDEAIHRSLEPYRKKNREELVQLLLFCMCEHPDLIEKLKERA